MGLLTSTPVPVRVPLICAAALLWLAGRAQAGDLELSLDLRAVVSDGQRSFLDDGLGKLRFDEDHQGIRLGRLRAAWNQPLGELFSAHLEASRWDDDDKNPIDLTEAYLEYRPVPRAGIKGRVRLGAFYPPMSLESRAIGWETPYTITPSAIGSWIGEEIRTIGLEGQVDWLGTRRGHDFDLQFSAAVFGWNDPAGTMIGAHGFAMHDRQTTLFGRVGEAEDVDLVFARDERATGARDLELPRGEPRQPLEHRVRVQHATERVRDEDDLLDGLRQETVGVPLVHAAGAYNRTGRDHIVWPGVAQGHTRLGDPWSDGSQRR